MAKSHEEEYEAPVTVTNTPRAGESAEQTAMRERRSREEYAASRVDDYDKHGFTAEDCRDYSSGEKPSNPKDSVGIFKAPLSRISAPVMIEVGLGMLEGDLKYGAHNYRVVGVRASIYYDATMRHLMDWWEGEDYDSDSLAGLHHVSKAISSLMVIRDAMIQDKFLDDRPPASPKGWMAVLNNKTKKLLAVLPRKAQPFTQKKHPAEPNRTWEG